MTDYSVERDILESELFKLLRYRKILDPDNNSSIVIGRIPKAFKDEGYKVLDCNFDEVLDSWITIVDMHDKFPEEWRSVRGYKGLYEVSNWGRVRSLNYRHTSETKIIMTVKHKSGYMIVLLYKNGKRKQTLVHRLVYEAFNGEIPEGYEVNHIDENKVNNRSDNLNLMSRKENVNWGTANKRRKKKISKPVLQFTLDGEFVKEWPSAMECGRNGFDHSAISKCCRGGLEKYKNYKWKIKE